MKILGLGIPELLIILVVVLIIFGPKHLPKLGATLGKTVKNLREGMSSKGTEEGNTDSVDDSSEVVSEETDTKAITSDEETQKPKTVKKVKVVKKTSDD